ncbi:MAG: hypothetical protein RIS29_2893 [Bacteroidota bacterium]|jgi:hypothetical protein
MKKIYYLSLASLFIALTACNDYNERNFPELDLTANPTNILSINYEMTSADYTTIANLVKKPVTDSITARKADLAAAKTKADSTAINAEITRLNTRLTTVPLYISATKIDQNKYFDETIKAKDYLPYLLKQKYASLDANSYVKVTYDMVNQNDTSSISSANKFILTDADYLQMGSSTNQPGKTLCFTPVMSIMNYLNTYLKIKSPYAAANEVRMVRYKFNSPTGLLVQYRVLTFNGTDWKCANSQFAFKKGVWQDVLILKGLIDGLGDFKAISVLGDQIWEWNSYKYMLMTGYVSSTKAYFDNEDWLVSPPMNLTERVNPWLNFTHVGRYFNAGTPSPAAMKKAISVWVSTVSDGVTIDSTQWKKLTIPEAGYPTGLNWTFIPSTPISLSEYAGKSNVRIAFRYLSSAKDGAAGSWEV